MTLRTRNSLAFTGLAAVVLLAGCRISFAPVPSRVMADEMQVYDAWLREYKHDSPERTLEVSSLTNPIPTNDISSYDIKAARQSLQKQGVPVDAFTELANLGDARYALPAPFNPDLAKFQNESGNVEGPCANADAALITFSRVVFSRDGKTALLYIVDAHCFHNSIGGGGAGYRLASKEANGWSFRRVGPQSIF